MNNPRSHTRKALLTAVIGATACGASAYEVPLTCLGTNMPPLEFHGFASQGFLYTSDYNYLANDTKNGSFQFSEFGGNVSMNPFPRTRIAVQGFAFDVGNVGQYDPTLDYALLEYTFNDQLGVRAGRLRRPAGIYNSIQDLDLARTAVLLPQSIYDARWRDFSGTIDGLELFGSVSLGKAGSLSYEPYIGMVSLQDNGGIARYIQDGLPPQPFGKFNGIDQTPIFGAQFWYNTPVDGLRVGVSAGYFDEWGYTVTVPLPPSYAETSIHTVANIPFEQYSLEYQHKSWTFQAEYFNYDLTGHQYVGPQSIGATETHPDSWYAGVSYRFNKWLEAGTYYSEYYGDVTHRDNSLAYQKDLTLSLRFDPKEWWIIKVEGHYIHGTGLLEDNADNPVAQQNDNGWFMLALKTTVSF